MTVSRVIRYQTTPECAEDNARLIRAVFAELAADGPADLHYEAFQLDDGVTFVHVATIEGESNPLDVSLAFAEFQQGLGARLADGPHASVSTVVGSHRGSVGG